MAFLPGGPFSLVDVKSFFATCVVFLSFFLLLTLRAFHPCHTKPDILTLTLLESTALHGCAQYLL